MKTTNFVSFLLSIIIGIYSSNSYAFDREGDVKFRPKNNISIGFFGDVSLMSVDYERLFISDQNFFFTGRIGVGINELPVSSSVLTLSSLKSYKEASNSYNTQSIHSTGPYYTIPHHITGNAGKGKHFIEFGLGGSYLSDKIDKSYFFYPILGYRLHPIKSGKFCFRFFLCIPFTGLETENMWHSPVGLHLGISL